MDEEENQRFNDALDQEKFLFLNGFEEEAEELEENISAMLDNEEKALKKLCKRTGK